MQSTDRQLESVAVALLYQTDEANTHLHQALEGLGARVVYETTTEHFKWAALEKSGAIIVIINLDEVSADRFDELDELLVDPTRRVIFNDADVSSRLRGWDLARWARHLAAKVLGENEVNPPRPKGSMAIPIRLNLPSRAGIIESQNQNTDLGMQPFPEPSLTQQTNRDVGLSERERALLQSVGTEDIPNAAMNFENAARLETEINSLAQIEADGFDISSNEIESLFDGVPQSSETRQAPPRQVVSDSSQSQFEQAEEFASNIPLAEFESQVENDLVTDFIPSDGDFLAESLSGFADLELSENFLNEDQAQNTLEEEDPFEALTKLAREQDEAKLRVSPTPTVAEKSRLEIAPEKNPNQKVSMASFGELSLEPTDGEVVAKPAGRASFGNVAEPIEIKNQSTKKIEKAADSFDSILSKFSLEDLDDETVTNTSPKIIPKAAAAAEKPSTNVLDEFAIDFDLEPLSDAQSATTTTTKSNSSSAKTNNDVLDDFLADFDLDPLNPEAAIIAPPSNLHSPQINLNSSSNNIKNAELGSTSDREALILEKFSLDSFADATLENLDATKIPAFQPKAEPVPNEHDGNEFNQDFIDQAFSSFGDDDTVNVSPVELESSAEQPIQSLDDWLSEFNVASAQIPGQEPERDIGSELDGNIQNIWVLGASIGGPEAVREFLSAIPANFPAVFIYAQHMGQDFYDLMVQQLERAVKLKVKAASADLLVEYGDVLVAPLHDRVLLDSNGVVQISAPEESSPYSPSIDQVLRDAANRFGSKANAIIFSGMAHDAIEGAIYLARKGGRIWVQDPASCVVSSMIDGALDAGIVQYQGTPAELASRMIAKFGNE